jgi:hypothetical protein
MDESEVDKPEPPILCVKCCSHPWLTDFVLKAGASGHKCGICGESDNSSTAPADAPQLVKLIRALVRYHFNEWQYNGHMGGEDIETLLSEGDPIVLTARAANEEALPIFYQRIFWPPYPPYDEGIAIYAGYQDSIQLPPRQALSQHTSEFLTEVSRKLKSGKPDNIDKDLNSKLLNILQNREVVIPRGRTFYRARIGSFAQFVDVFDFDQTISYQPYMDSEIGAPPAEKSTPGRVNKKGIPVLYLATDEITAAAEVRPHPGHHVSLGAFITYDELRVAYFGDLNIGEFSNSDVDLELFHLGISLDRELSTPITPEERHRFTTTQLVADLIRSQGYDAIQYRSSVGPGTNLCVFEPEKLRYIYDQSSVVFVKSLKYEIEEVPTIYDPQDLMRISP